jgi:Domain of unknown function (DUF4034)
MRGFIVASGIFLLNGVLLAPALDSLGFRQTVSQHFFADFNRQEAAPQEQSGSNDADSQSARDFRAAVRVLFDHEKFDQLDRMAAKVRSEKERFRAGSWKLFSFYQVVQDPGAITSTDAVWDAHIARLRRWIAAKPDSITPRIALAQAYLRLGWKARGRGYSDTVTSNDWKVFRERIQRARDTLEQAESLTPRDPQWFRSMQTVALAQGWDRNQADDLLQHASSFEPAYFYFYNAHANFLLPEWYGKRGEAEAFAQSIADRIGGTDGDYIYARIALEFNCCKPKPQMPDLSWDRVKKGFAAMEQLYGTTNYLANKMAYMAVRQGDRTFAQQMFARIGDDWDEEVWRSKERFNNARSSLTLEGTIQTKQ